MANLVPALAPREPHPDRDNREDDAKESNLDLEGPVFTGFRRRDRLVCARHGFHLVVRRIQA